VPPLSNTWVELAGRPAPLHLRPADRNPIMHFATGKEQYHRMNRAGFGQAPDASPNHLINDPRSWTNYLARSHERYRPGSRSSVRKSALRRYEGAQPTPNFSETSGMERRLLRRPSPSEEAFPEPRETQPSQIRSPAGSPVERVPWRALRASAPAPTHRKLPHFLSLTSMPLRSSASSSPICLPLTFNTTPLEFVSSATFAPPATATPACAAV